MKNKIIKNPFNSLKKKRDVVFDLLKLIALLLVIMDHSLQRWIENCQATQLYNFIFLTQMPVFMFVSGYFSFKHYSKIELFSPKDRLIDALKRVASLLIPFISFALIKAIIMNDLSNIYLSFLYPQRSLWFLWALLCIDLMMLISQNIIIIFKVKTKIKSFLFSSILYLAFLTLFIIIYLINSALFDSKLIIYYSIFFLFGYLWSYLTDELIILSRKWTKLTVLMTSLCVLVMVMLVRPTIIFDSETIINMGLRILGSVSAILVVFELCSFASKYKCVDYISRLGRLSLEFYYAHLLLFMIPIFVETTSNYLLFLLMYLLTILTSFLTIIVLKTFYITDLICFGKIIKKEANKNV